MGSIIAVLFAWLAQLQMLPTGMELQQQAARTTTMVTTAQEETQILAAASPYIQQNLTAIQAAATASTPYTISIAQLTAANIGPNGLPSGFSSINPYGQTWQVQVFQPSAGNLQAYVIGIGGQKLTDMQGAGIASYVGAAGGFVSQNDSGIYPTGRIYGNAAAWNLPVVGGSMTGGQPVAMIALNNGQQQNLALYRVAVPGQPQLNTASTDISLGGNNLNNANKVNANQVITPAGNGVQVGSSYYYGDGSNSAIRQNGALYIQNQAGTGAADIAQVGNVNSSGQVTANTIVSNGNIWASNGTVTAAAMHSTGNLQVDGSGQVNGNLTANGQITSGGYIAVNGPASPGGACPGPQYIGAGPSGPLLCESGVWSSGGGIGTIWYGTGNVSGVNYQNTTGHAIDVVVTVNCTAGGGVPGEGTLYSWAAGQSPVALADTYGQCGYQDRIPLVSASREPFSTLD